MNRPDPTRHEPDPYALPGWATIALWVVLVALLLLVAVA